MKKNQSSKVELSLIEKLFLLRKREGMTQDELAAKLSIPVRTLRAWEQGTRKPSAAGVQLVNQLIEETENDEPTTAAA